MLRAFRVRNYALFRDAYVEWPSGFTALTGESGAGKSQLLGALLSTLGQRWEASNMGPFGPSTMLTATFEVGAAHALWEGLAGLDLSADDLLSVSREVNAEGRSLFRLQGRLVPRQAVTDIAPWLLEVMHQGHVSRFANHQVFLDWLDHYLQLEDQLTPVKESFHLWQIKLREQEELVREALDERDWTVSRDALAEIEEAQIRPGEDRDLSEKLDRFRSMSRLDEAYQRAYQLFEGDGEDGTLTRLRLLERELSQLAQWDNGLAELSEKMVIATENSIDVRHQLEQWWDGLDRDPVMQERIEARSHQLAQLKRRYGPELDDVIAYGQTLRLELEHHQDIVDRIARLARQVRAHEKHYLDLAGSLSAARRQGVKRAGQALTDLLRQLEMPSAELTIKLQAGTASAFGTDGVSFWFSANAGRELAPLPRGASGGELARIGLAMAVLVQAEPVSTLWLDEVDTGLGGRSAARVAEMLRDLGKTVQVIAITHQPVVASAANAQVMVAKRSADQRTEAHLALLDGDARVVEVARMLSGGVDPTALTHAKRLLQQA